MGGLALAGLTLLTAVCGALASVNAPVLYAALQRPDWAPPASVFGPVWSVLYLLMIVAAWLVWQRRGQSGVGSRWGCTCWRWFPTASGPGFSSAGSRAWLRSWM